MVNRRLVWLLLLLPLTIVASAAAGKGPLIRISEREVDFGRVDQFKQVHHRLTLRNEGDAPLRILKIDSDCGCTAGVSADSTILPGQEVPMEISFSTRDYQGEQHKTVSIKTNDPAEPTVRIDVRADVVPFVRVSSERVRFASVQIGKTTTETVRFSSAKDFGLKIEKIEGGEDCLTTRIEPDPNAREDAYALSLSVRPDAPAGPFRRVVKVTTRGNVARTFHIITTGQVLSYFIVKGDPRIALPATPAGKSASSSIAVTCDGTKDYDLLEATSSLPFLKAEVIREEATAYRVKVTLLKDAPPGGYRGSIHVKTSDPKQPTLDLVVQGMVRG